MNYPTPRMLRVADELGINEYDVLKVIDTYTRLAHEETNSKEAIRAKAIALLVKLENIKEKNG